MTINLHQIIDTLYSINSIKQNSNNDLKQLKWVLNLNHNLTIEGSYLAENNYLEVVYNLGDFSYEEQNEILVVNESVISKGKLEAKLAQNLRLISINYKNENKNLVNLIYRFTISFEMISKPEALSRILDVCFNEIYTLTEIREIIVRKRSLNYLKENN